MLTIGYEARSLVLHSWDKYPLLFEAMQASHSQMRRTTRIRLVVSAIVGCFRQRTGNKRLRPTFVPLD
jgi:hypothetical protein